VAPPRAVPQAPAVRERVAQFGAGLLGIETTPAGWARSNADDRPGVILLNAGVIHRIGPHRMNVTIARRIAQAGYPALRFDLSGVGDSRSRGTASYDKAAVDDIRQAMDELGSTTGARRFLLVGICSGADNALNAALVDDRVAGAALLDPYSYRTRGFYLRKFAKRALNIKGTIASLRSRVASRLKAAIVPAESAAPVTPETKPAVPQYSRRFPPREVFAASLRRLLDRGTELLILYSGGLGEIYNYAGQFDDAFRPYGLAGRLRCHFVPDATHTYTEIATQRLLCDMLVTWVESVPRRPVTPGGADERAR